MITCYVYDPLDVSSYGFHTVYKYIQSACVTSTTSLMIQHMCFRDGWCMFWTVLVSPWKAHVFKLIGYTHQWCHYTCYWLHAPDWTSSSLPIKHWNSTRLHVGSTLTHVTEVCPFACPNSAGLHVGGLANWMLECLGHQIPDVCPVKWAWEFPPIHICKLLKCGCLHYPCTGIVKHICLAQLQYMWMELGHNTHKQPELDTHTQHIYSSP